MIWNLKLIQIPRPDGMDSIKQGGNTDGNVPSLNHPDVFGTSRPGEIGVLNTIGPHTIIEDETIYDDNNIMDIKEYNGKAEMGGLKVIELNGDGRLMSNGAQKYIDQLRVMKGDVMVIVDTGLTTAKLEVFSRELIRLDSSLCTQAIPAREQLKKNKRKGRSESTNQGRAMGGILVIARSDIEHCMGKLHPDGSKTGFMGKIRIYGPLQAYTLIAVHWPQPASDQQIVENPAKAWAILQSWINKENMRGSPTDWLKKVINTWTTVAQSSGDTTVILGDFNASETPTLSGNYGTNGKLSELILKQLGMVSVQNRLMEEQQPTYWVGDDGISCVDHFIMTKEDLSLVRTTSIDISSYTLSLSAHKPIALGLTFSKETQVEPIPDPPLPNELAIQKDENNEYVASPARDAMNDCMDRFLDKNFSKWDEDRECGSADRMLYQMSKKSAIAVAKVMNTEHHLKRKKPKGWSPMQLVLYAQLSALVEIRRRIYGLSGRRQWRKEEVRSGIQILSEKWYSLTKKYRKNLVGIQEHRIGIDPVELRSLPIEALSRAMLDDMIHQVNSHLHYARRAKMRLDIKESLRLREEKYQQKKYRQVLNSVLKRSTNRYSYKSITRKDGTITYQPEEIQSTLNEAFTEWYAPHPGLIPLAKFLQEDDTIWKDFSRQRDIPNMSNTIDSGLPKELVQLFTEALLSTSDADLLFQDMREALTKEILIEDFKQAINARSNNKSPGITGFSINMMKQWSERALSAAHSLMSYMWEKRHVPKHWRDKWIVLIPKDNDKNVRVDRLRPICLLETTRKVWTAIIMYRITQVTEKHNVLQDMQSGFRKGQSTETSLIQFINTLEQAEQTVAPLYYTSYDISKAFDRPTKNIIQMAWCRIGVPPDIAQWLSNLDVGGKAYIKSPWAQHHVPKME